MLPAGIAYIDPLGLCECEGGVPRENARVRVPVSEHIADPWRRELVLEILHHPGKVGTDIHASNDPACILALRAEQRNQGLLNCSHVDSRIEHRAKVAIVQVTAGRDDYRLSRTDIEPGPRLVAGPVLPKAFQARVRVRVEPRRVARFDL